MEFLSSERFLYRLKVWLLRGWVGTATASPDCWFATSLRLVSQLSPIHMTSYRDIL